MSTETYTNAELDQVVGAALFVGRLHNSIANLLDTTHYREDAGLFEFLNMLPAEMVYELLPATTLLLSEVKARIDRLIPAIDAALDSTIEGQEAAVPDSEFAKIMRAEFGKDRKKNGS